MNVVDYYNGASFVAQPPPDGLAEFKVQTSNYSAEIGHGAGAVVNASLKSGTNQIHGSAWEYLRNTAFDINDWNNKGQPVPTYHENQFGATLGLPILKNKIFFFGDVQANRIVFDETSNNISVPTALERTGNFSELLQAPSVTGESAPIQLYAQTPCPASSETCTQPTKIANNNLATSGPRDQSNRQGFSCFRIIRSPTRTAASWLTITSSPVRPATTLSSGIRAWMR